MCAKGWRGKTRFNPSGIKTYVREYDHNPPSNLLEGRGTESGAHVDILGNFQLLEDVLRVATGASGEDLGPKHAVVFVPGIVTGGLELWEGHECAEGLFRKKLWGGTFAEVYK
nr:lecithine cholesterol acyltransferase [Tanacetum cinerariifolium]